MIFLRPATFHTSRVVQGKTSRGLSATAGYLLSQRNRSRPTALELSCGYPRSTIGHSQHTAERLLLRQNYSTPILIWVPISHKEVLHKWTLSLWVKKIPPMEVVMNER